MGDPALGPAGALAPASDLQHPRTPRPPVFRRDELPSRREVGGGSSAPGTLERTLNRLVPGPIRELKRGVIFSALLLDSTRSVMASKRLRAEPDVRAEPSAPLLGSPDLPEPSSRRGTLMPVEAILGRFGAARRRSSGCGGSRILRQFPPRAFEIRMEAVIPDLHAQGAAVTKK